MSCFNELYVVIRVIFRRESFVEVSEEKHFIFDPMDFVIKFLIFGYRKPEAGVGSVFGSTTLPNNLSL